MFCGTQQLSIQNVTENIEKVRLRRRHSLIWFYVGITGFLLFAQTLNDEVNPWSTTAFDDE